MSLTASQAVCDTGNDRAVTNDLSQAHVLKFTGHKVNLTGAHGKVLILHAMMHIIVMEDEAKRKLQGHQAGVAARLTAEELEKVFGGAGRTKARHGCQLRATKDAALSKIGF